MDADIARLIAKPIMPPPLRSPLVIYGAGNTGRAVYTHLTSVGYRIDAFLDANAGPGQCWHGIPVYKPQEWLKVNKPTSHEAVVAIHNYAVDMAPLLEELRSMRFARVVNMIEYQNLFPDDRTFRYWLTSGAYYRTFADEIEQVSAILADDTSKEWLNTTLAFRLSGDYARLPAPNPAGQYGPDDLPRWMNPMRLIDCGAFNGDTIGQFARRHGYRFEAIAAFEPEPANFSALARYAALHGPAVCFPCGVGASTSLVRFQSGQGMGSRSSSGGDVVIQCVAIDEALGNFNPTLIKMDVEGAELDALRGARRVITSSRPGLAICVYHEPAHLWQIPLLIRGWNLGYKLYLRGHSYSGFDLVLYAIP